MTLPLQLKLFGSPQISYQGQPLTGFVSTKVRALLIYLAVTARPHSRDHLAHLLWEDTPASMKPNLRKALSNLRQLIGDLLVEEGKDHIALDPQRCWVDVVAFEHALKSAALTEAAQLYTADFLDGFNPSLSYEFEAWTLREQSRLKSGMVDLLRKLATQQETRNTLPEAIQTVRRLLDLEPWQEESHRWLMTLLVKNGQRGAALAHFEVCKRVLQEELAVAPSAETLQLVAQIQQATLPVHKPAAKLPSIAQPEFPLIGREREWQTIQAAWQHCLENGPHFVCIAGEAGIGKTRLTEEARLWVAQQGYASAYARSYAAEGALAFSPVVDWLRSEAIRPSLGQLDAVWLKEVARLLPELLTEYSHLSQPQPIGDGMQRRHFFEALARAMLANEDPLLLVIDDLQWCDQETLAWLRFLMRFDAKSSFLVLGGFRVEEVNPQHRLHELLVSLRQTEQLTEFELGALDAQETSKLLDEAAGEHLTDSQAASFYQETAGHPLFVIEQVRSQNGKVIGSLNGKSSKLQNVIQTRLALLSAETRQLIDLAATVGRSFSFQLLQTASQQDESMLYESLDELWQRRMILEKDQSQFDFTHDRIRETVYANIRPLNRQRLHHQIAETLVSVYAENLTEWNAQIAMHYENAGKLSEALSYFVEAAQTSINRCTYVDALKVINRALTLTNQLPTLHTNLHNTLTLSIIHYEVLRETKGHTEPQLRDIAERVRLISEKLNDDVRNYRARTWLLIYHALRAEHTQAKDLAEANILFTQHVGDPAILGEAYFDLASISFTMGEPTIAKIWYERSNTLKNYPVTTFPYSDTEQFNCVEFYISYATCCYLLGYLGQAERWATSAIVMAESFGYPAVLMSALRYLLMFLFFARRFDLIKSKTELLYVMSEKYGFVFPFEWSKLYQGWVSVLEGNCEHGINMIKHANEYFEQKQYYLRKTIRLSMLAESFRLSHRYEDGIATVHEALAIAEGTHELFWIPELYRLQGELLLQSDVNHHEVEDSYQKSLTISRQQSSRLLELRTSVSLARLWQTQGKSTEAYQLLVPIYAWFTEGFDMPDLIGAKQLLDEITTDVSLPHCSTPPAPPQ